MRFTPSIVAAAIALFGISVVLGSPSPQEADVHAGDESPGICLRACFNDRIDCPEGWNAQQMGDCWTCCRAIYSEPGPDASTGTNNGAGSGAPAGGVAPSVGASGGGGTNTGAAAGVTAGVAGVGGSGATS